MMDIVFIGSTALLKRGIWRKTNDVDIICSYDDFTKYAETDTCKKVYPSSGARKLIAQHNIGLMIEAEITWDGSNAKELFDLIVNDERTECSVFKGGAFYYPSIDVLYMLKMSHRYLRNSPAFLKTLQDIKALREHGAKFDERYMEWYKKREKETYYYDHPSLDKTKKEFFTDNVQYVYDHDSIHESVKILEKPAYTYFMKDGAEVATDKNKFFNLPVDIQLAAVMEESYVLAIERHQVPNDFKPNPHQSFLLALEKVCTSITSGYFREFAWENYHIVADLYEDYNKDETYVDKFKKALYDGNIKSFTRGY